MKLVPLRIVAIICGGVACSMLSLGAGAQGSPDPTRPPQSVEAMGQDFPATGPVLQSIMISPTRRSAIIGGQLVVLGQKYGEAKLVRVTESEVTLVQGKETTVLRLFPGIDKKMIAAAPVGPAAARKKTKSQTKSREQ